MKQIKDSISPNEQMSQPKDAITLYFMDMIFDEIFEHTNNELSHLKGYSYVYALLDYGRYSSNTDLFQYIDRKSLKLMQKKKAFFIFDAGNEGFSPYDWFPIFDVLYFNCRKYKVDPSMIIYVTGNLKDPENMQRYSSINRVKPIHIVPLLIFETSTGHPGHNMDIESPHTALKTESRLARRNHQDKIFSSLSRLNRGLRTLSQFLLCQREASNHALISHDVLNERDLDELITRCRNMGIPQEEVEEWTKTLPLVVDHTDFDINWAGESYEHIHRKTIFQIVNETQASSYGNTSLFYSEKTFKPILHYQPFIIWGQPGANHALKDYGYMLYDDWFDLSFDFEEDDHERCQMMLDSVDKAVNKLKDMSVNDRIKWRFKNKRVLMNNYRVLTNSPNNISTLYEFFKQLRA